MKRFIEGADRDQSRMLSELLDDYVDEDNQVRVVDVFVDQLDLASLEFECVQPASTGRPAYHPSVLRKLYIYGYLNRMQSSRRLEREAQPHLTYIPTLAHYLSLNGSAIKAFIHFWGLKAALLAVAVAFLRASHIKRYGAVKRVLALQI
jgi:transposase